MTFFLLYSSTAFLYVAKVSVVNKVTKYLDKDKNKKLNVTTERQGVMNISEYSRKYNLSDGYSIFAVGIITILVGLAIPIVFLISIIFSLTMACLTWWRLKKRRKSLFHGLVGAILVFVVFWMTDRYGQWSFPESFFRYRSLFYISASFFLIIYLAFVIRNDIKACISLDEKPLPENWWRGWVFFFSIFTGGILLTIGLNYGAKQIGLCKFPPAYYLFSPDIEPKEGIATGLISRNDFDCKFLGNTIPSRFESPIKNILPISFKESYSHDLFGDYLRESRHLFVDQYIWVTNDKVTEMDVQIAMEFESRYQDEILIPNIHLPKIRGANYQVIKCYDEFEPSCEAVIGFEHILTKFRIVTGSDTTLDVLQEIVDLVVLKTGKRLLVIDQNLP